MYNLLLTSAERSAIDWIGDRYDHGDDLRGHLTECEMIADEVESEDIEWSGDYEIEFKSDFKILLSDGLFKKACDISPDDDIDDDFINKYK